MSSRQHRGVQCSSLLPHAIQLWESVQVELHGQYSVNRLHALHEYIDTASICQVFAIILLTPLPCFCLVVCIDCLPLMSPTEGIAKQTIGFWIRGYYTCWSMVYLIATQVCEIVPALASPAPLLFMVSLPVAAAMTIVVYGQMRVIGFPVPFTFYMQIVPWTVLAGSSLWLMWRPTIKRDPTTKKNFLRRLKATRVHILASVAYIVYNVVYNQLSDHAQTGFLILLPLMKLFFKIRISKALSHLEDLTPAIVVLHIDVFHGLFVSLTLQQATISSSVVGVTLVIDIVQLVIAFFEVRAVHYRLLDLSKILEATCP